LVSISPVLGQTVCGIKVIGKVVDEHDDVPLDYANIYVEELGTGVASDELGNFIINDLCPGEIHLAVSHLGCETRKYAIDLKGDTSIVLVLEHHEQLLSTITVNAHKNELDETNAQASISGNMLEQQRGNDLAEITRSIAGVNIIKTGVGVSTPVIHGLSGNRLTIVNNQNVQEGQLWSNEHAPEIDPSAAQKISVVKGAAAVKYGNRSMGGVLLIDSPELPMDHHTHGKVSIGFKSNNKATLLGGTLEGGFGHHSNWRWRLQANSKLAGDAQSPNYNLSNTGIRQYSGAFTTGRIGEKSVSKAIVSYYNAEFGILRGAHIGNLTDLQTAIERNEPFFTEGFSYQINNPKQAVQHFNAQAQHKQYFNEKSSLQAVYNFQLNVRKEFDIRRGNRSDIPSTSLNLQTHTLKVNYQLKHNKLFNLETGAVYKIQFNRNTPGTGVSPLIPYYNLMETSLYAIEKWEKGKVLLEAGIRYEYRDLLVKKFDDSDVLLEPSHRNHSFASNIGGAIKFTDDFTYRLNVGTAFRPPHVNELYSEGLHHVSASIEEGNADLKIEKGLKAIQTLTYSKGERFNYEISVYSQWITDYIYQQILPEPRLTIRGAFPVYVYQQADAHIWGIDFSGRTQLYERLHWEIKAATVRAKNLETGNWLPLMPADNISTGLNYAFNKLWKFKDFSLFANADYVFEQKRLDEDFEYAAAPSNYWLLHAGLSAKFIKNGKETAIYAQVNNITNKAYRSYTNRLRYFSDEQGIDFNISVNYKF